MNEELNSYIAECNDIDELKEIIESAKGRLEQITKYDEEVK